MSMLSLRRSQKQSGFTLMELLIVIAVLGLLLGMLIPRLAGITDDTVDTVCDTNNKGIRYYTQAFYNKNNALPNGLTNLVDYSASTGYGYDTDGDGMTAPAYMPSFQDDGADGAEDLAWEFYTRNHPNPWFLDADEVIELRDMGITSVYNYVGNSAANNTTQNTTRSMMKESLAEDCVVMMMGMTSTASDAGEAMGLDTTTGETITEGSTFGNPLWLGRIMMAVNDQCDLVKQGYIQASALCPGAVLAEENFSIKEYIIVLPRLQATVDRVKGSLIADGATMEFIDSSAGDSENSTGRVLDDTFEAQAAWNFDMSCPEGHKWPDNDEDSWVLFTNTDNADAITSFSEGSETTTTTTTTD